MRPDDLEGALIMDFRGAGAPKTLKVKKKVGALSAFCPYSAILPSIGRDEQVRHRETQLAQNSNEYKLISRLFTGTFRG